jgi:hypothetical protein
VTAAPPTITSVSPTQDTQGQAFSVTITGTYFTGATVVSFGTGITVNSFTVDSATQITANITIAPTAATGTRDVSVTTPGGTATLTGGFTVTAAPPTITSITPNQDDQGQAFSVTITGTYFTGSSSVNFGTGITVNNFTVDSPTQITANISIDPTATTGARDVSVTTPGGTATLTGGFTVTAAPPTISSVSPDQGNQDQTLDVTITGTYLTGATVVGFGAEITVNSFTLDSSTQITANITIAPAAATGARDVSVTTPGGTATLTGGLTVYLSIWSSMSSGTTNNLLGVWGSSASDVFAVGNSGTILHYDGSTWSSMSSGTTSHLRGVWGSSASDVFAMGNSGTILHYDGSTWSPMTSGTTNTLRGIWGSSSSDVLVVANSGAILHYDGSTWSPMSSGTTNTLYGVWGSSATDVFVMGASGTILHYDGSVWSSMTSGTTNTLYGAWGTSPYDVFAVGRTGTILHYMQYTAPPISSVSPTQGTQGQTLDVIITGTHFTGTTLVSFGVGITVNSFTVDSATQITANITIDVAATTGARDVMVTTPGGTGTMAGGFTMI